MNRKGISSDKAKEYLNYVKNLTPNEEITFILKYLKDYGFPDDWYEFDPTIARSFSYSMGPIWEVEIPEAGGLSVLGGERYDGLIEKLAGKDIGGTGFGLGFDRTLEAADALGLTPTITTSGQILMTVFAVGSLPQALEITRLLRSGGVYTDLYPAPDKLDKQLKYADRKGIPYVVIQGPDEAKRNVMKLKNMQTKEQEELTVQQVIDKLTVAS